MKIISPVELQTILAAQPSSPVIDVRTPVEFAEVHVPQARNVPLDELKPSVLQFSKDQPVYLLCRSGQRATKAAEKFAKEGFLQPVVVEGGTLAWIDANCR
jgi:rhodanese-related sulfurtransferase